MRMKRAKEKREAAQIEQMEKRLKTRVHLSPEEAEAQERKRHAKRHGRPSHYGKPVTYYQRINTPKHLRTA